MNKWFAPPRTAVIYTAENDGHIENCDAEGVKEINRVTIPYASHECRRIEYSHPELIGRLRWVDSEEFDRYTEQTSLFDRKGGVNE